MCWYFYLKNPISIISSPLLLRSREPKLKTKSLPLSHFCGRNGTHVWGFLAEAKPSSIHLVRSFTEPLRYSFFPLASSLILAEPSHRCCGISRQPELHGSNSISHLSPKFLLLSGFSRAANRTNPNGHPSFMNSESFTNSCRSPPSQASAEHLVLWSILSTRAPSSEQQQMPAAETSPFLCFLCLSLLRNS